MDLQARTRGLQATSWILPPPNLPSTSSRTPACLSLPLNLTFRPALGGAFTHLRHTNVYHSGPL